MFALTIDQRRSRSGADAVPELLTQLAAVPAELGFERTVGDEIQALLGEPAAVIDALHIVIRDGGWSAGLGIGAVRRPLPGSVREASGPALVDAREAVEAAKTAGPVRVSVRSASSPAYAAEIEALVRLIGLVLERRTDSQWRIVDAVREHDTQRAASQALAISPQAVSKALATAAVDVEDAGYPLLERLLAAADDAGDERSGTR
ncbi:hypothetical protein EK0264_05845 [Epidermidibacterium keratini]|uniref:MarR family transcriptional regulator n=1 Tax=Epidermidibacterium keratini TaxID=1891644 RepID=A0A7L4YLB6_9ACTN|nr:hypothetical protein [Epidermidibacterium keratini]QHB99851.1 hypothetical protein EK0264_05845 [Epidermidibacterium keratini]